MKQEQHWLIFMFAIQMRALAQIQTYMQKYKQVFRNIVLESLFNFLRVVVDVIKQLAAECSFIVPIWRP